MLVDIRMAEQEERLLRQTVFVLCEHERLRHSCAYLRRAVAARGEAGAAVRRDAMQV